MCYDISFTVSIKQLSDYFPELIFDDQIRIDFALSVHIIGHEYGLHPIIYNNREDNQLHCKLMEWGCIPYYIKDEEAYKKQRPTMLNARSERILDDAKSYWNKIRNRRCLIPVTGFYEHREVKGFKNKIPYFIQLREQPVFFIPGLYSVAELLNKETGELEKRFSFSMVTREANEVMAQIHNGGTNAGRMPLLVPFDLAGKWLQQEISEEEYRDVLHFSMAGDAMRFHTVYTIRTPKTRPDEKGKNEYYQWKDLPEIVA